MTRDQIDYTGPGPFLAGKKHKSLLQNKKFTASVLRHSSFQQQIYLILHLICTLKALIYISKSWMYLKECDIRNAKHQSNIISSGIRHALVVLNNSHNPNWTCAKETVGYLTYYLKDPVEMSNLL